MTWTALDDRSAEAEWDRDLVTLSHYTLPQTYGWGEYKRREGWTPKRFRKLGTGGAVEAMAQVLVRRYGVLAAQAWSAGGPLGDPAHWDAGFRKVVKARVGAGVFYLRFLSHLHADPVLRDQLVRQGWAQVEQPLSLGLSMQLNLSGGRDGLLAGMTSNWRHNLKRAARHGLTLRRWENPDPAEVMAVYNAMESHKGLRTDQFYTAESFGALLRSLGDSVVLYRCDDQAGDVVSLRGCATLGHHGWDLFAATTAEGRKLYASYALFWRVMEHCVDAGMREYDLAGIDPEKNPGVYNFKKGTGAAPIQYLGEWEWANLPGVRAAAAVAARRRAEA